VHGIAAPDLDDSDLAARNRTKQGRLRMLLVLAVCAAPVIASYLTYFVIRPNMHSSYGQLIVPTRSLPEDLTLTRLDGQPVSARSLRGQWLLVAVGPSACDAACEKRLFAQRQFREMLGRERDRVDKVWLITDSAPLTPALAAAIAAKPEVTALRADPAALARWLVPAEGQALPDHLYVVDPMGEFMMRLPPQPDPGKTKRDLERLLRASASWDTPGR
jgi:cytochrome oxidase Cu insertion factor (SCO1/SenC/PrrC family)